MALGEEALKAFWYLTGASAASTLGNTFLFLAVPLALLAHTGDPLVSVLSVAARTVPYVFAPFLGAFIDRYDRRTMFAGADVVQAAAVALIPVALWWDVTPAVFAALILQGLANVVSNVAADYGLIPALVPAERLDRAMSQFNTIILVARFAGPALAGVLVTVSGPSWALFLDAITFLLTAATVRFMPAMRPPGDRTPLGRMLREGVAYFRERPDIVRLTLVVSLYNLGAGALEPTLLVVGRERWGWSASALGVAVSGAALGAALGAWLSPRALINENRHRQIAVWFALSAAGAVLLMAPSPYAAAAGFVVLSIGEGGVNTATVSYRQKQIPPHLAGRVNTIIRGFVTGAVPVSAFLLGLTAQLGTNLGVFLPVVVSSMIVVPLWLLRNPARPPTSSPVSAAEAVT
ncbi:MFS transporter [Actinoplanes sp. NPDC049316]|uniref:MFS transporter n=1 Tax=Actinoplanes sp. NPDC049316 TaxID=3154727 RepID=UPI00342B3051